MAVANLGDLLNHAAANGYAVPTIPVSCVEVLRASIEAAEESRAPLVLALDYARTPGMLAAAAAHAASEAKVPVSLLCTGVRDTDSALAAVRMGCNALSLYGDPEDFAANVRLAREVHELLGPAGITLEGTLGLETGEPATGWTTLPSEAKEYSRRAPVHAMQVAFGTRGDSDRPDFKRLSRLRQSTAVPLATAAALALEPDDFHRLIARGISRFDCGLRVQRAIDQALTERSPIGGSESLQQVTCEVARAEACALFKHTHSAGRLAEVMLHCPKELSSFNVLNFEVPAEREDEAREVLTEYQALLLTIPGVQEVDLGYNGETNGKVRFTTMLRCASAEAMERAAAHSACQELSQTMTALSIGPAGGGLPPLGAMLPTRSTVRAPRK